MNTEEKATAVAELAATFGRARLAIVTESAGLPVNQVTELRKLLRGAKAEYKVVKNTLAARAAEGTILSGVTTYLKGPTGLVIGYDDPVLPAKILRDFLLAEKRDQKMKITIGVLEGKVVQPAELAAVRSYRRRKSSLQCCCRPCRDRRAAGVYAQCDLVEICESHCSHSRQTKRRRGYVDDYGKIVTGRVDQSH
jgi:Ribosomal protein L10